MLRIVGPLMPVASDAKRVAVLILGCSRRLEIRPQMLERRDRYRTELVVPEAEALILASLSKGRVALFRLFGFMGG